MTSFNREPSFLRRTAQEAQRRKRIEDNVPDEIEGEILPIFWRESFLFNEGEEPNHINQFPTNPKYVNLFEVLGGAEIDRAYRLAADVPTFSMASLLVAARVRKQEATKRLHKYTESLWIVKPDKETLLAYTGELDEN